MMQDYSLDRADHVWTRKDYERKIDYSDGAAVEQQMYAAVTNSTDVSVLSDELESHIVDWPSHYAFSRKRANLLRPFASLFKGKYILEPGCGAGSITRFLGECGAYVYAVEPNRQRAKIAAARCRDLENVSIFCDDIDHFQTRRQFDGILLIGVLEYANRYGAEKQAALHFLTHLKNMLKQDGFMITAIENQLGLKYFSGFLEDHIGIMMHGINNNYQPGQAATMGRKELITLFETAGFASNQLFLPFPDYKLPSVVFYPGFHEKNRTAGLHIENILSGISSQDPQSYTPLFSLDKALPLIAQNELLYELSNSFCLFSAFEETTVFDEHILFTSYNTERKKEYCKETVFTQQEGQVKVVRNYLCDRQPGMENYISFEPEEPVYPGVLHHVELVKILNHNNWHIDQLQAWLLQWFACLKTEFIGQYSFSPYDLLQPGLPISGAYIDTIPVNLIRLKGTYRFINREIKWPQDIELGYLIFRAIYASLSRLSSMAPPAEPRHAAVDHIMHALFASLGIPITTTHLERYYATEAMLQSKLSGIPISKINGKMTHIRVRPVN